MRIEAVVLHVLMVVFIASVDGQGAATHYPTFSWETVPVGFHFGKSESLMTAKEAEFVASQASFICLEKEHASKPFGHTEAGIEREARQLKKYNPNMKVVFYWNTLLDYPMFQAHEVYQEHPEWWLRTLDGELDKRMGESDDTIYPILRSEIGGQMLLKRR